MMLRNLQDIFWVLPGKLAGMSHPGEREEVFRELREAGIGGIVTLTERPIPAGRIEDYGFDYLHLPVKDFTAPTQEQVERFVEFCDRLIGDGKAVLVHCRAGIGRTGVMLACYLVHKGQEPHKAIRHVRRLRPGALETPEQEDAVFSFAGGVDLTNA